MRKSLLFLLVVGALVALAIVFLGRSLSSSMDAAENVSANMDGLDYTGSAGSIANAAMTSEIEPNAVIYCDLIRDRTTRSDCDRVTEFVTRLDVGSGAVGHPRTMIRGETANIGFVVSSDTRPASVSDLLGTKPEAEVALKIGRIMAAQLQGDGFKIEPVGLQKRDLFAADGARWDWKVTALKAPRHRLSLSAYVVLPSQDGAEKENILKTLELPLSVTVTWGQWFDDFVADTSKRVENATALGKLLLGLVGVLSLLATALGIRTLWRSIKRRKSHSSGT